ncbi:unnamed protein product, partial [Iphiclides podalirius]
MEESRKSKVSTQLIRGSIREGSNRDTDFGPKSISRLKMRRTSFGFTSVPGIKPVDRTSQESPALALRIAAEVMRKLKTFNFNRYRIITVVTIAQKRAQSYNNAISFLWDHERDAYVDLMREVNTAFVQVTTFGIYLD